jgi:serine protease AprX
VGSPGAARQVITIGAAAREDRTASFSSRGPTSDGRCKPDLLFPGVDIVAARAQGTSMGMVVSEHYTAASGTSMATPHAAGAAALLLEALPELTPQEIKARLMGTAIDLDEDPFTQGKGLADAWRARHNEIEPAPTPPTDEGPSLGEGCLTFLAKALLIWER